jgi:hypothetical protein
MANLLYIVYKLTVNILQTLCKLGISDAASSRAAAEHRPPSSSLATRQPRRLMKKQQMHASQYSVPERLIRGDSRIFSDITFKICKKLFIPAVSSKNTRWNASMYLFGRY